MNHVTNDDYFYSELAVSYIPGSQPSEYSPASYPLFFKNYVMVLYIADD